MQIHELAEQIRYEGNSPLRTPEFDSREAGQVLEDCAPYAIRLQHGEFVKTDKGYARFDLGDVVHGHDLRPSYVNKVSVRYVSEEGDDTKVGSIYPRIGRSPLVAVVQAHRLHESSGTTIKPDDERWGTIVGCVRDAIQECKARKALQAAEFTS